MQQQHRPLFYSISSLSLSGCIPSAVVFSYFLGGGILRKVFSQMYKFKRHRRSHVCSLIPQMWVAALLCGRGSGSPWVSVALGVFIVRIVFNERGRHSARRSQPYRENQIQRRRFVGWLRIRCTQQSESLLLLLSEKGYIVNFIVCVIEKKSSTHSLFCGERKHNKCPKFNHQRVSRHWLTNAAASNSVSKLVLLIILNRITVW